MVKSININKKCREYGIVRIQPQALEELSKFIDMWFERAIPDIKNIALKQGRVTIYTEDIIRYFGYPLNDIENIEEKIGEETP